MKSEHEWQKIGLTDIVTTKMIQDDVLEDAKKIRLAALHYVGRVLNLNPDCKMLCTAHQILASNKLPGDDQTPPINTTSEGTL